MIASIPCRSGIFPSARNRGAIRNGVTRDEVREIPIHTGPPCGWPATLDAVRVARRVFAEIEAGEPGETPAGPG